MSHLLCMPPLHFRRGSADGTSVFSRERGFRHALVTFIALTLAGAFANGAHAAGKSFFFATREACNAVRLFNRNECANAFANAASEVRARAPSFAVKTECVLRFALCEVDHVSGHYSPIMLGVEIFDAGSGGLTEPVLGVANPPGLFQPHTIRSLVTVVSPPSEEDPSRAASLSSSIMQPPLPSDHFVTFGDAQDSSETKHPVETPAQRKARLQQAPFIE